MKTTHRREKWNRLVQKFREYRRHESFTHDRWLVLNMAAFNFINWCRHSGLLISATISQRLHGNCLNIARNFEVRIACRDGG